MRYPAKDFLFPAANILVTVFLLSVLFISAKNVSQTFRVAAIAALNNLQPQPTNYFLELDARAAPDINTIHCYEDYYEHLLRVFPNLWDAYGMLGYCFHYLNNDPKAISYLKTAIQHSPDNFWDDYNLAAIYVNESRYQEALDLLQKALNVPPVASLKKMFSSPMVYLPLFEPDENKAFAYTAGHLKETYRSVFALAGILNRTGDSPQAQAMMKKLKLELYAF